MPWWGYILSAVVLGFWGWVAVKIVYLEKELAALKQWSLSKDKDCEQRLQWIWGMDKKLDTLCADASEIKGYLNRGKGKG